MVWILLWVAEQERQLSFNLRSDDMFHLLSIWMHPIFRQMTPLDQIELPKPVETDNFSPPEHSRSCHFIAICCHFTNLTPALPAAEEPKKKIQMRAADDLLEKKGCSAFQNSSSIEL